MRRAPLLLSWALSLSWGLCARAAEGRPRGERAGERDEPARESAHEPAHEHSSAAEGAAEGAAPPSPRAARLAALDQRVLHTLAAREEALVELTALNARRVRLEVALGALERELLTRERAIARGVTLRRRLTAARVAEVLLRADGPLDLKRRELSLQALFRVGARELKTLRAEREGVARERAALAETLARLEALTETLEAQVGALLSLRGEEARLLRGEEGALPLNPAAAARRRLSPPTLGLWEDRFQSFRGPHGAQLAGAGVWIRGVLDAPVYAVEDGVVRFSGEVRALGRVLILEHKGGLLSVYGALGATQVAPGARVGRQEQVGAVGRAPEGAGLYFELRRDGRPLYPREWVEERPALPPPGR